MVCIRHRLRQITACETSSRNKYQRLFFQFSEPPIHFQSQSLKHNITISSELEPQTLGGDQSISSRDLSTLKKKKEKKMIRKKTGAVSNRPLLRLTSEAVSRRPLEGSGNGSHRRKRPTLIVRF